MRKMRVATVTLAAMMVISGCSNGEPSSTTTTVLEDAAAPTTSLAAVEETPSTEADMLAIGDNPEDTSCAPDQLPTLTPGELTIATPDHLAEPWFVDGDPSNAQGFEAGVAYAMSDVMGLGYDQVNWVQLPEASILDGSGAFDVAIGQFPLTTDNLDLVDHSVPYFYRQRGIVGAPGGEIAEATDLLDLLDFRLGVVMGTSEADYTVQVIGTVEPPIFETWEEAYAAVAAGDIDGVVVPTPLEVDPAEFGAEMVLAFPAGDIDGDPVVAILPEASSLLPCIDTAIESVVANGVANSLAIGWIPIISDVPLLITEALKTEYVLDEVGIEVDYAFRIPAGSWDQYLAGVTLDIMPTSIDAVVGEIIEIVNEDEVGYIIGPFYVGPNETMRQRFLSVGEFFGRCAVSTSGDILVRVAEA